MYAFNACIWTQDEKYIYIYICKKLYSFQFFVTARVVFFCPPSKGFRKKRVKSRGNTESRFVHNNPNYRNTSERNTFCGIRVFSDTRRTFANIVIKNPKKRDWHRASEADGLVGISTSFQSELFWKNFLDSRAQRNRSKLSPETFASGRSPRVLKIPLAATIIVYIIMWKKQALV